ncbi:MAG: diguanylate cyclase [Pseudomonadota bacterium]
MKFDESSDQAAHLLRQAIPAMVKYNIVPNPLNYTLWYSYFSNAFPHLKNDLDLAIKRYGTCPQKVGEDLFVKHITQFDEGDEERLAEFQQAFANTVSNLSNTLDETSLQANQHSAALKDSINSLEAFDLDEAVAPVLRSLNDNATAIVDANDEFKGQIRAALAEIESLKKELADSQKSANTDPLTGLSNRRVFEAIFTQFVDTNTDEAEISLIIMDIDKFKIFNDTHGHLLGDQILKYVGNLLLSECPNDVTPVRFGGEEFAVLCPNQDLNQAKSIAEKIRAKLESVPYFNKKTGEKIPPVTASFGVALKQPKECLTDILERADNALYAAKGGGRNQVQVAI